MSQAPDHEPSSLEANHAEGQSGQRQIAVERSKPQGAASSVAHASTLPDQREMETLPAEPSAQEPRSASERWSARRLPVVDPGSYQVKGEVAQGGIGRILRARSVSLGRTVALKQLLGPSKSTEERFVREALVTARLQHPSIVPVYEAGRWPTGEPFYTMKLVAGRSLAELIAESATLEERLALLRHVLAAAEAIAYAHSKRIIHRDLKPANILVGDFGETVVIDWGLAKDLAESDAGDRVSDVAASAMSHGASIPQGLTMTGSILGTPAYMPPEQALGEPVDERADVYAIGAILYHLLAGISPYEGRTAIEILRKVITGPPYPIEKLQKNLAEELSAIVHKAMAREPAERYPTARELAEDLRRFETGQIVGAHRYSSLQLFKRFVKRYRAPLGVAAFSLLALGLVGAYGMERTIEARHSAEEKQREAEQAEKRAIEHADELTLVQARAAAESDPNKAISWLKSLSPQFSNWSAARVIAANAKAHGLAHVLRGHTQIVDGLTFSPDGKELVTASDDHTLRIWDPLKGTSKLLEGHGDEVWRAAYSRDGKELYSVSKDRSIRAWDAKTGESRGIIGVQDHPLRPITTADALFVQGNDGSLWHWDTTSRKGRPIFERSDDREVCGVTSDVRVVALCSVKQASAVIKYLETGEERPLEEWSVHLDKSGPKAPPGLHFFSPDGKTITRRRKSGALDLWDTKTGSKRILGNDDTKEPLAIRPFGLVAYSHDSAFVASAGSDNSVHVFGIPDGNELVYQGPEGLISNVSFSPDGKWLAASGYDHDVWLWDRSTGQGRALHGNEDVALWAVFSPDSQWLATSGHDGVVRLFPVIADAAQITIPHGSKVTAVTFSADGELVVSGNDAGEVLVWDGMAKEALRFADLESPVNSVEVSPDGSRITALATDGSLAVWSRFGDLVLMAPGHADTEWKGAQLLPDGATFVYGDADGHVHLRDIDSGKERVFSGHEKAVSAIAISRDGTRIASGSVDKTIRVWDVKSGSQIDLAGHEGLITGLSFSPDGANLASGSNDHTLRVWNLSTGASRTVGASGGGIKQVAFTPDGESVITLNLLATGIDVWNAATLEPKTTLRGHTGEVQSFVISPDGTRAATASVDKTVRLWDFSSGESRELSGHSGVVSHVLFSPDGSRVAAGSEDGTVRIWSDDLPMSPDALRAWIQVADRDTPKKPSQN